MIFVVESLEMYPKILVVESPSAASTFTYADLERDSKVLDKSTTVRTLLNVPLRSVAADTTAGVGQVDVGTRIAGRLRNAEQVAEVVVWLFSHETTPFVKHEASAGK